MKKIYSLVMVTAIAMTANAQLVINENFSGYNTTSPSNNLVGQGSWTTGGSTGSDVKVLNTTPLIYSGYQSGTEYVQMIGGAGIDPQKTFLGGATIATNATQFIYMSFVVRVNSGSTGNPGDGFQSVSLLTANGNTPARFYIDGNGTNVRFGVAVGSEIPAWTNYSYNFGQTYLIVMQYDINNGNNNDDVYLWINPASLATPPATGSANLSHVSSNGEVSNGSTFTGLKLNQATGGTPSYATANASFDAFRVAYGTSTTIAWSNLGAAGSSLPVVLTSFNAAVEGLNTKIIWNTADEMDIANYVIEKSTDGRSFTAIGTVKATNQKTYSFSDGANGDNTFYRLKMVDQDGAFKYSYVVSIKSKLNANISLSPNPVRNNLMIQHPKLTTDGHIQIVSVNGSVLKDIKVAANAVISYVDMSGFTSGLYHVVFRSGADKFTKTVVKD